MNVENRSLAWLASLLACFLGGCGADEAATANSGAGGHGRVS